MAKYSFPQFKVEIIDPTIENIQVTDNIEKLTCSVSCVLVDPSGSRFGVDFNGFNYEQTWSDQNILHFLELELAKHKVK